MNNIYCIDPVIMPKNIYFIQEEIFNFFERSKSYKKATNYIEVIRDDKFSA
jgi:hypothetical protein